MSFHRFLELPVEMRQHIFERCEVRDLHSCLQIEELRTAVQSVMERRPLFWRNGAIQTFPEFLEGVQGTRFSTADEVYKFLEEVKRSHPRPFLNGVVIFIAAEDGNRRKLRRFHGAFRQLVNRYPGAINKLVYCLFNYFESDIFYSSQLENICRLYNLESLAIYYGSSYEKTVYTPTHSDFYPEPVYRNAPKLRELLIFPFVEDEHRNPFKPPLINYLSLVPNFFGCLEYLQFPWARQDHRLLACYPEFNNILNIISIPKLKKLKLTLFRNQFVSFPTFSNSQRTPLLEEISLLVVPTNGLTLLNSIRFFDRQASSLKSFFLNFRVETQVTPEHPRDSELLFQFLNFNVVYPNLKQASIDISIFIADFANAWNIFRSKFLQLEKLTLLNNLVAESTAAVPFKSRAYCLQLWETLPATLKEIRVPHLNLILERGQVPPNLE